MKKFAAFIICLALMLSVCSCASEKPAEPTATPEPTESYSVSFQNYGRQRTITKAPKKVVTAGPNCTEMMCALGLGDLVIGKCMENHSLGALPEYADVVAAIPTLSVGYPTAEQIIASGCDFLFATSWIFDDDLSIEQLERNGITVYVNDAKTIDEVFNELRDLGAIFGADAETLVSEQSQRLEAVTATIAEAAAEPKTVAVLDSFIGDEVYTAGSANIETECITKAGGANPFTDIMEPWGAVEPEELVVANPYCIIIHDYSGSGYDDKIAAIQADPELSQLECVQAGRIIRISLEDAMPGMRSVSLVETIAKTLYPECFE